MTLEGGHVATELPSPGVTISLMMSMEVITQ
jgi:hypothetical protein